MSTAKEEYTQLELFRNHLPNVCACTDALGVTMYRMRTIAEKMRYIGPNQPNSISYIVHDLDKPLSVLAWEDYNCPPPNLVTVNPDNGHAHYLHALASPVHFNPASSKKAQRYLGAVDVALGRKLGADPGYQGNLTKNPLHPHWPTICFSDVAYDLDTLSAHLDLDPYMDLRRHLPAEGLGRNCRLFEGLRWIAYRERRCAAQGWFGFEFFLNFVEAQGHRLNQEFPSPLGDREVHGIAKSIAQWTWDNLSPEGFRLWGDNRRAKSIRVRHAQSEIRAGRIRELAREFPAATQVQIAAIVGLSERSVRYALNQR
jgi:hypothetical protein